ncbi:cache domain-containing protein, partial [Aliivibrio sifiae]
MKLLSNRKLLRVLQYLPIAIILVFTVVLNFFIVKDNNIKVDILVESVRADVIGTQKQKIKSNIDQLYQQINHEKKLVEQVAREKFRFRVDTAISIANGLLLENQDKPVEEVKQLIIDALRPIRFDDGRGYFYISTLDGMSVMHPITPDLENTSILNRIDSRGNYYIQHKKEELNNKGEA